MKILKKTELKLDKEVISALTDMDLTKLRGGQDVKPKSDMWVTKDIECTANGFACQSGNTCYIESVDVCVQTRSNCVQTKDCIKPSLQICLHPSELPETI